MSDECLSADTTKKGVGKKERAPLIEWEFREGESDWQPNRSLRPFQRPNRNDGAGAGGQSPASYCFSWSQSVVGSGIRRNWVLLRSMQS